MTSRCASPKCWHTATVRLRPHEQSGFEIAPHPRKRSGSLNMNDAHNLGAKPKAEAVADILAAIKERRA